ncbi:hypothetical protein [Rhodococcus sp. (in: high G+C Gram-positive bacteria)]|uniref:hypothetical protein n=1 Tax=Rhodococcus sp. TaxID=1831 RepID=UPI003B8A88EC
MSTIATRDTPVARSETHLLALCSAYVALAAYTEGDCDGGTVNDTDILNWIADLVADLRHLVDVLGADWTAVTRLSDKYHHNETVAATSSNNRTRTASGTVDSGSWLAQLQAPDDHGLDHVAVLPSEAAALAQVATWCREDACAYASELPAGSSPIDDETDDAAAIALWTERLGGVRYRVAPITPADQNSQETESVR